MHVYIYKHEKPKTIKFWSLKLKVSLQKKKKKEGGDGDYMYTTLLQKCPKESLNES